MESQSMKNTVERQEFSIDGLRYELTMTSPGGVNLLLIGGYSPKIGDIRRAREEYDPFQKWEDDDPYDFFLKWDEDVGADVSALTRQCMHRVIGWVKRMRPGYFVISPSTDRRERIYDRLCARMETRLPEYNRQKIRRSHYFYRLRNDDPRPGVGTATATCTFSKQHESGSC